VVTRRALLLAGGATLFAAGCGKDDEPESPTASATSAMLRELASERALASDLRGADGLAGRIGDRAAARATRLAAAISSLGGRPHDAADPAPGSGDRSLASRHAREALEAHVAALPSLTGPLRKMGADLVAESAADAGLLGATAGDAFPGTPA
jgi:hypothetical protein